MKLYWGSPANPGQMKFHTSTLLSKPIGEARKAQKRFTTHEIVGLYGVQIGKTFVGTVALGQYGAEAGTWEPYAPRALAEQEGRDDE